MLSLGNLKLYTCLSLVTRYIFLFVSTGLDLEPHGRLYVTVSKSQNISVVDLVGVKLPTWWESVKGFLHHHHTDLISLDKLSPTSEPMVSYIEGKGNG